MKQIKDGKRSNLSGDSLEKRVIPFITAHLERLAYYAQIKEVMKKCLVTMTSGKNV